MKPRQKPSDWDCHIASPGEWSSALACWHDQLHGAELLDVQDFQLRQGSFPADGLWIACSDDRIDAIVWVWPEPGGYAHVWPLRISPQLDEQCRHLCGQTLWQTAAGYYSEHQTCLFQTLIPVLHPSDLLQMKELGFHQVAEIQRLGRGAESRDAFSSSEISLAPLTDSDTASFLAVMQESLQGSLDVPELNALQMHGEVSEHGFDASYDRYTIRHGQHGSIGVMVLQTDGVSGLVRYLGLTPGYRRRGYATEAVKLAVSLLTAMGCKSIELRVDSRNDPALQLYHKLKFECFARENMLIFRL